jgi:tetratricopeptide (TPR) repeat protein
MKSRFLAIEIEPDHTWSHNNLGKALDELGRTDEAAQELQRAVDADGDNVEARYNLGTIQLRLGHVDDAIASLRAALVLKSDLPFARENLAWAYARKGDATLALREWRTLAQLHPELPQPWLESARLLAAAGEKAEAARCVQRAVEAGGDAAREAVRRDPLLAELDLAPAPK